jgi:hypothetical protein
VLLGIDHLVIAVADPDASVDELAMRLGLQPGGGGKHPAWGTSNRLLWLGDTFIEILGVDDPELAERCWLGRPALAARAAWPTLVGWAIATDDLDADATALNGLGADYQPPIPGERHRPDGRLVRWRLALPPRIALDRPFLIEHDPTSAEWTPADRAQRSSAPARLREIELPVDRVHGLTVGAHDRAVTIGEQRIVTRGPSLDGPTLHVTGLGPPRRLSMLGCDWSFV